MPRSRYTPGPKGTFPRFWVSLPWELAGAWGATPFYRPSQGASRILGMGSGRSLGRRQSYPPALTTLWSSHRRSSRRPRRRFMGDATSSLPNSGTLARMSRRSTHRRRCFACALLWRAECPGASAGSYDARRSECLRPRRRCCRFMTFWPTGSSRRRHTRLALLFKGSGSGDEPSGALYEAEKLCPLCFRTATDSSRRALRMVEGLSPSWLLSPPSDQIGN